MGVEADALASRSAQVGRGRILGSEVIIKSRSSDLQSSTACRRGNNLHETSIHGGDTVIEKR